MSIYDISGNNIGGTEADVEQAFLDLVASGEINLGAQVGATLAYNGLTNAWVTNATTAYNSMKTSYVSLANEAVPFFISTDQHGRGLEQHRWANNTDGDGISFANINLGDTVTDSFNFTQVNQALGRTKQVKNYIGVVGNHDAYMSGADKPTVYDLTRVFMSTYNRAVPTGQHDSYTIDDEIHDITFVVSDNYIHNSDGTMVNDALSSDYCDWLIGELSKDERDIVFIQHWMVYASKGVYKYRDGTAQSTDNIGGPQQLRTLLVGRKAKTNGSITDASGGTHSFDFRNCTHDLLCCLHGHQHEELYAELDGLLCYVADWYGNNGSCVFGLVDRKNEKLRIWKFDSTQTYSELVLDL